MLCGWSLENWVEVDWQGWAGLGRAGRYLVQVQVCGACLGGAQGGDRWFGFLYFLCAFLPVILGTGWHSLGKCIVVKMFWWGAAFHSSGQTFLCQEQLDLFRAEMQFLYLYKHARGSEVN